MARPRAAHRSERPRSQALRSRKIQGDELMSLDGGPKNETRPSSRDGRVLGTRKLGTATGAARANWFKAKDHKRRTPAPLGTNFTGLIPRWIDTQTDLRSWSLLGETVANIGHIRDRTKDNWLNVQQNPSVALTSAAASPGSVPVCPASSTMSRRADGQTLCKAHALCIGVTMS